VTGSRAARWAGLALAAWALDFAAMYAWVTFACPRPALGWITTAACAAGALAALVGALRADQTSGDRSEIETSRLGRDVARLIALLSLIAILWLGIAVLSPPTCAPAA
jgi:polyferredoxin